MTTFSLGMFDGVPGATAGAFGRNLLFVGLGNLVGGALLVGAAYAVVGLPGKQEATAPVEAGFEPEPSTSPART